MKKIKTISFFIICFLFICSSVKAETIQNRIQNLKNNIKQERQVIQNVINEKKDEIKSASDESKKGLIEQLKKTIKSKLSKRIHGKLTLINDTTLMVLSDKEVVYTVNILSSTQLRRRFGAATTLSEFSIGDELALVGATHKISESEYLETEIDAKLIRNLSIQRRNAVFIGSVLMKEPDFFTIETQSKGVQTVYIDYATVYTQKNLAISYAQIQVRDKVVVKGGLWDRALDQIDAKKVMKLVLSKLTSTPTPSP